MLEEITTTSIRRRIHAPAYMKLMPSCAMRLAVIVQCIQPEEIRGRSKLFLDAQQLVVLCDAVCTRGRAGLDLSHTGRDREVRDECIFGLAGTMRDDGGVSVAAREVDRV